MGTAVLTVTDRPVAATATPRRRFRLLDAMILVAATAMGCGIIQWSELGFSWSEIYELWDRFRQSPSEYWHDVLAGTLELAYLATPFVLTWTLALIPIRLLGPRPRFRRLVRQPGMMAACAACVPIFFLGLEFVLAATVFGWEPPAGLLFDPEAMLLFGPVFVGLAVLVSWVTLIAGRRWRAEPSWVDRLGRGMGVSWIVAGLTVTPLILLGMQNQGFRIRYVNQPPAVQVPTGDIEPSPDAPSP